MLVPDPDLLEAFRGPGLCERCGQWFPRRDPHHAFVAKGLGGGSQLDLPENLISLCRGCHSAAHALSLEAVHCRFLICQRLLNAPGVRTLEVWPSRVLEWLQSVLRAPKEGPLPARPWECQNATDDALARDRNRQAHPDHPPQGEEGLRGHGVRGAVSPEPPADRSPSVEAPESLWRDL